MICPEFEKKNGNAGSSGPESCSGVLFLAQGPPGSCRGCTYAPVAHPTPSELAVMILFRSGLGVTGNGNGISSNGTATNNPGNPNLRNDEKMLKIFTLPLVPLPLMPLPFPQRRLSAGKVP